MTPSVIEMQAGTRLVLDVTNTDAMRHDLVLATGQQRGTAFHVVGAQLHTVSAEGAYRLEAANAEQGAPQVMDLAAAHRGGRPARTSRARSLPVR